MKFTKPFWEEIKADQVREGDVVYLWYNAKASYDHYRIINGKWFNIFRDKFDDYLRPEGKVHQKIYRQNYRFVSKADEWFVQGTEAYLESHPDGNGDSGYWALFRGWHQDEKTGETGEDGETCTFDEFDIEEL